MRKIFNMNNQIKINPNATLEWLLEQLEERLVELKAAILHLQTDLKRTSQTADALRQEIEAKLNITSE